MEIVTRPAPNRDEGTVRVVSKCAVCKNVEEFQIPKTGLKARRKGILIADAFPTLSLERQRQLSDHVCPKCQGQPT